MLDGCPSLSLAFECIVRQRAICKPSFWPMLESEDFARFLQQEREYDRPKQIAKNA
jgi:hypothetical protein